MFKNPRDPENVTIKAKVKEWLNKHLELDEELYTVRVNEIECFDPACPGTETILMVVGEHNIRTIKISKPLVFVRERDVEAALRHV